LTLEAARALLRLEDHPTAPLRVLVAALREDPRRGLRPFALECLSDNLARPWRSLVLPPPPHTTAIPHEAVPSLFELLADEGQRPRAARVLGGMTHAAEKIVPQVNALLPTADSSLCGYLLAIVGKLGPAAKGTVPEILRRLARDRSEETRRAAFAALRTLGPEAKEAIPVLLEAAKDPKAPGHSEAFWTLGHVGAGSKEVLDVLVGVLRDRKVGRPGRADGRSAAAWALARLGPAAKPAIPALRAALLDDDAIVRVHATAALVAAGEDSEAHFRLLLRAWRDTYDPEESYSILPQLLDALGLLGSRAAPAVPRLVELLERTPADRHDPDHRTEAARALGRIGPGAKAALPRLRELTAHAGDLGDLAAAVIEVIEGRKGVSP
jgi:HEAT repeat protein